jgi:hypothetical protein
MAKLAIEYWYKISFDEMNKYADTFEIFNAASI